MAGLTNPLRKLQFLINDLHFIMKQGVLGVANLLHPPMQDIGEFNPL